MMTKIKKWGVQLLMVFVLTCIMPVQMLTSLAADAKITFTDLTATVGEEISIRVKIAAQSGEIARSEMQLTYDSSILEFQNGSDAEGGAGSIRLSGTANQSATQVYNLKFKTLQPGKTTISVESQEVYDTDENMMNITHTGSSAVEVKAPATSSKDAALRELTVSPGTLTPAFSPEVMNYSVEVGLETERLIVDAVTNNANAKTEVSGAELTADESTVVCVVTAEDGQTKKEYSITVKKVEGGATVKPGDTTEVPAYTPGDMSAVVGDKTFEVAKQFDESTLPEGFEASDYSYHDTEVRAGIGLQKDAVLMYLVDAEGNGGLYMYHKDTDSFSPWVEISVSSKTVSVLPMDESIEIPVGFVEASIDVVIGENKKQTVQGWVWESDEQHQYCVFYGMNWNGEKGLYRYDFKEQTVQRYFQDPAVDTGISHDVYDTLVQNFNDLVVDYNKRMAVIVGLLVAVVVLLGIVIGLASKLAKKNRQNKRTESEQREDTSRSVKREETEKAEAKKEEDSCDLEPVEEMYEEALTQKAEAETRRPETQRAEKTSEIYGLEKNLEGELAKDVSEIRESMIRERKAEDIDAADDLEDVDDIEEMDDLEDVEDDFDLIDLDNQE